MARVPARKTSKLVSVDVTGYVELWRERCVIRGEHGAKWQWLKKARSGRVRERKAQK